MNATLPVQGAPVRPTLSPRLALDAWRGIPADLVRTTFLLGAALFAYHFIVRISASPDATIGMYLRHFVRAEIFAFALMLCVVVADRVAGESGRRAGYAIAVVIGTAAATALVWTTESVLFPFDERRILRLLYIQLENMLLGGATVFVYVDRRRARAAQASLHRAELERVDAEKHALEARLKTMQARVEPQFLFDTLGRVRQLYERDAALAERMLDELIVYLRAAMPRMRDPSSTVGQEIDLARAYLSIARIGAGEKLRFAIDVPNEAIDARLPPMILLPLVERAALSSDSAPAERSIRVVIAPEGGRLQLRVVTDTGPSMVDRGIAEIRERLTALYDNRASLAIRGAETVLDLPLELGR